MAQTPQAGEPGGAGDTPAAGQPQGLLGNSTTILLIVFGVAVFFWSRRRRAALEARMQEQRRERDASAEQSALDVARIMRQPVSRETATAAAREGLASAAPDADRAVVMERAEASAAAERAAEEQATRAARAAELAGASEERRMAAGEATAEETRADTADALGARPVRANGDPSSPPAGAIAGDGTAICPAQFPIKGNASSRIYHEPGQTSYPPTIAEFCFASAEAAQAAGFRQSKARVQRGQK